MSKEDFVLAVKELGIELNEVQLNQLHEYYLMLIEWNSFMNLTGITEEKEVYLKHFYDSLTVVKALDINKQQTLCDIGTGAGFPGLVLKICFPNLNVTLVDSLQKRINFLQAVIKKLDLNKISAIHSRVEDYAIKNRERFDIVTARAVAPLNILIEYCLPLIKPNKYFVAMKGSISQELDKFDNSLSKIDGVILCNRQFLLPYENSQRSILLISKLGNTLNKYPRKYSEIKRNPL